VGRVCPFEAGAVGVWLVGVWLVGDVVGVWAVPGCGACGVLGAAVAGCATEGGELGVWVAGVSTTVGSTVAGAVACGPCAIEFSTTGAGIADGGVAGESTVTDAGVAGAWVVGAWVGGAGLVGFWVVGLVGVAGWSARACTAGESTDDWPSGGGIATGGVEGFDVTGATLCGWSVVAEGGLDVGDSNPGRPLATGGGGASTVMPVVAAPLVDSPVSCCGVGASDCGNCALSAPATGVTGGAVPGALTVAGFALGLIVRPPAGSGAGLVAGLVAGAVAGSGAGLVAGSAIGFPAGLVCGLASG